MVSACCIALSSLKRTDYRPDVQVLVHTLLHLHTAHPQRLVVLLSGTLETVACIAEGCSLSSAV